MEQNHHGIARRFGGVRSHDPGPKRPERLDFHDGWLARIQAPRKGFVDGSRTVRIVSTMTAMAHSLNPRTRRNLPLLWTLVRSPKAIWRFLTKGAWGPRLFALLAVIYVIVPIDLIPDIAPIVGWLDDVGAATAAAGWVATEIMKDLRREDAEAIQADSTADLTSS